MPYLELKLNTKIRKIDIWGCHVETKLIFLYQILKKLQNGYSPIIGICGSQRIGKSFIGVWIGYILYLIKKENYDPTNITFYEPEKAIIAMENKNKDLIFIDEAADVMDYQEWQKQTHKALRSVINTQAYKSNIFIFVSPFIHQIDKSLRIHCDFIIHVKSRGNFVVWRYKKYYDAEKSENAIRRIFLDSVKIRMSDVPTDIWNKYIEFSIKEKEKILSKRLIQVQRINNKDMNAYSLFNEKREFDGRFS